MARCRWWVRWLHQRKREADVLYLLPSIKLRAELLATAHPSIRPLSREWFEEVERLTDRAFELHRQRRGAEHWRCPCAKAEQLSA